MTFYNFAGATKTMKPYYLIILAGGSASGKSTLLNALKNHYSNGELCIISMDDYYKPIQYQKKDDKGIYNFDLPESLDDKALKKDLETLALGRSFDRLEYTFNHPEKIPALKHFEPAPVVVVEGLFTFWFSWLRKLSDYKVFIETDTQICYQRRKDRDLKERGIPIDIFEHQWNHHVLPAYKKYLEPFKKEASLIIYNNENFDRGLRELISHINHVLK